jgi:hypothetical protein
MSKSNGFSKLPHGFHKRLREFNESRLKVWLAHRCMEGKAGTSYPSVETIAAYTGLNIHTVSTARKWLRDNGWLVSKGQSRAPRGRFSVPVEHTEVPSITVSTIPTDGHPGTVGRIPTDGQASNKATVGTIPTGGTVCMLTADRPTADRPTADRQPTSEVDPAFEVGPKKELHPSNPPTTGPEGGATGGKPFSEATPTATGNEILLTEELMLEALQRAHRKIFNEHDHRTGGKLTDFLDVPMSPNLAGAKELFNELCKRGITRVEQMNLVCVAYRDWFEAKFLDSFEKNYEARMKKEEAEDSNFVQRIPYVPDPIIRPLMVFRKELTIFLEQATEYLEEAAAFAAAKSK